jgi:4-hydroxy-tetrahydrodipicolinate synthase
VGCVSATANVNARAIVELFNRTVAAAVPEGLEVRVNAVRAAFERFPVIPALKAYLAAAIGDDTWRNVRPPLVPLGQAETAALRERLATLDAPLREPGASIPKK